MRPTLTCGSDLNGLHRWESGPGAAPVLPLAALPYRWGSAQSRNETDANDASMMVQPFP